MIKTMTTSLSWDGVTRPETYKESWQQIRNRLADCAHSYQWNEVLEIIREHPEMSNATRLGGKSGYTPLHQAAYGGAPLAVVEALIGLGAWRTLRTYQGERPVDIARARGHTSLTDLLEPVYRRSVPDETLSRIQEHFHRLIRERAGSLVEEHGLRLPELEPLLEYDDCKVGFKIPGMYGGFGFWLEVNPIGVLLWSESWSRVVGGSGQTHVISPFGVLLVDEGFV